MCTRVLEILTLLELASREYCYFSSFLLLCVLDHSWTCSALYYLGSVLKDHLWLWSGNHYVVLGIKSWLIVCKAIALPAVLSLQFFFFLQTTVSSLFIFCCLYFYNKNNIIILHLRYCYTTSLIHYPKALPPISPAPSNHSSIVFPLTQSLSLNLIFFHLSCFILLRILSDWEFDFKETFRSLFCYKNWMWQYYKSIEIQSLSFSPNKHPTSFSVSWVWEVQSLKCKNPLKSRYRVTPLGQSCVHRNVAIYEIDEIVANSVRFYIA